jgi:ketosteroid isomerase-like protein
MSEATVDLVRRHFEVMWNQRDTSCVDSLMAEDFVEHGAAPFASEAPGRVHGPEAMRGTVEWLTDQFPDLTMEIEAIVAEGDLVVARVRARGSNSGVHQGGVRRAR